MVRGWIEISFYGSLHERGWLELRIVRFISLCLCVYIFLINFLHAFISLNNLRGNDKEENVCTLISLYKHELHDNVTLS